MKSKQFLDVNMFSFFKIQQLSNIHFQNLAFYEGYYQFKGEITNCRQTKMAFDTDLLDNKEIFYQRYLGLKLNRETFGDIDFYRLFPPQAINIPGNKKILNDVYISSDTLFLLIGLENLRVMLLCKSKKCKNDHLRSLMSVNLIAEIGCLPLLRLKPKFYLKNLLEDCYEGPHILPLSDCKDSSLYNFKFPKILTSEWSDDNKNIFKSKQGLLIDLEYLDTMKNRSDSFLKIFQFKIVIDAEEIQEISQMIRCYRY